MSKSISRILFAVVVLVFPCNTNAAGIQLLGVTVSVDGTPMADQVTVQYVNGKQGQPSRSPTGFVQVSILNLGLTETYPTADVELISLDALSGDDFFQNLTAIPTEAIGGPGNDLFIGGLATDNFDGGEGNDELLGGPGNDVLAGGNGSDLLSGGPGFDFITGGDGDDLLDGGTEDDSCFAGNGQDIIHCGPGNDIADGGDGIDTINGNDGRDILIGGLGRDFLSGGAEEDIVVGANVLFPLVHQSLGLIWIEWTSTHTFGIRARNVLGYPHSEFADRLNENEFLLCGITVGDDGALDEIDTLDGTGDIVFTDTVDSVLSDGSDVEICP